MTSNQKKDEASLLVRPRQNVGRNKQNDLQQENILYIPVENIVPDEDQPRKNFSSLGEIISSIESNGQLMPIVVSELEDGKYKIIDGERRYRAIKVIADNKGDNLSEVKIKAICYGNALDANIGFIINLIRENYSPVEIAMALDKLKKSGDKITDEQIGKQIGKSRQNVGEYLSLLKLPQYVLDMEIEHNLVPFYQLKQLAVNANESNADEKIDEYKKLMEEYTITKEDVFFASKPLDPITDPVNENMAITKKVNAIAKKLDSTTKAIVKFDVGKIINPADRHTLSEKLEIIIKDAQAMKDLLDKPI